jgi:WD40 repeat protein
MVAIRIRDNTKLSFNTRRACIIFRCMAAEASGVVAAISVDSDGVLWSDVFDKNSRKKRCSIRLGEYAHQGGDLAAAIAAATEDVQDVNLSAQGKYLGICNGHGEYRIYDAISGDSVFQFKDGKVYRASFFPDETRCVLLGKNGTANIVDIRSGMATESFKVGNTEKNTFAFFEDKSSTVVRVNGDLSVLMTTLPDDPYIRYWSLAR